jgi:hypothetical protein
MKKIAIFVEGQTELLFIERLLIEIAGRNHIEIELHEERGKVIRLISAASAGGQKYFAMIVDCGSDNRVASAMLDSENTLVSAGYSLVLGLRDLFPLTAAELPELQTKMSALFVARPIPFVVHIAASEVEAWFLQEDEHFQLIDARCTHAAILASTGYDIVIGVAESLYQPAEILHQAYQVGGRAYRKTKTQVQRTISVLDYTRLYISKREVLPSFDRFLSEIEAFL